MKIVREYKTSKEFEKGLGKESSLGWHLDSWRVVANGGKVAVIIAIFRA